VVAALVHARACVRIRVSGLVIVVGT
jgi:hypothetical protein